MFFFNSSYICGQHSGIKINLKDQAGTIERPPGGAWYFQEMVDTDTAAAGLSVGAQPVS